MSEVRTALKERGCDDPSLITGSKPPSKVKIMPRLSHDIEALHELFSPESPPQRPVRSKKFTEDVYMFRDAFGSGFISSLFIETRLFYQHGQWLEANLEKSSNIRELSNLINAIKDASKKGLLEKYGTLHYHKQFYCRVGFL